MEITSLKKSDLAPNVWLHSSVGMVENCTGIAEVTGSNHVEVGASGPGSCPARGHCVVFLGKALYSHRASLHPGV